MVERKEVMEDMVVRRVDILVMTTKTTLARALTLARRVVTVLKLATAVEKSANVPAFYLAAKLWLERKSILLRNVSFGC